MLRSLISKVSSVSPSCGFHTTACLNEVRLLTRLRVVDNSEIGKRAMAEGKPPKVICVYNKQRKFISFLTANKHILFGGHLHIHGHRSQYLANWYNSPEGDISSGQDVT